MQNNKVTYNLMSFTAFKSMLLFSYLQAQPRSYEEIREYFANQTYLNETISIDTLRVYINSLERIGCEIVRGKKSEGSKYRLVKHPFELKLNDEQIKNLLKVCKMLLKDIDIEELLYLSKFFKKIAHSIENELLRETLMQISPLNKVNSEIVLALIKACRKNEEISFSYQSPSSGLKKIDLLAEKITVKNSKIYLHGFSPNYKNGACFLVSKIKDVPVTKITKTIDKSESCVKIGCEIYDKKYELSDNEKIIAEYEDKIVIEITSDNIFLATQKILSLSNQCSVLYPEEFRENLISTLKNMRAQYATKEI